MFRLQRQLENTLSYISAAAVAFMMIITVADVLVRYLTPWNVPGSYSFVSLAFVFVIYLGLALAQRENAHIAIEALYGKMPRSARKVVQGLQLAVLFGFIAALTWYTGVSAWKNYSMGDTILGAIAVVTWPARIMIPIGLFFLAARFLKQFYQLVFQDSLIEERHEPQHEEV
ncbi:MULTISPECIES: TRAP transporter small permease [Roseobacteraceae]|uniref:TRAP transporter small permease n=1 Tax=Roseobacteraceae TaxID=2854170 RepID=UPI00147FF7ED|nr:MULTISPECIES: TRAP transporter small permease [Roseobacteraceae]NOD85902.1 TRAP transporter small permease subunit [Ruegeria sp. HKCCD6119]UWQ81467.1 TRAP transporter small permease [Leisingera sp. S132]